MNDVRLDPEQVPARTELLLAAELGEDAPGRPIYARLEPDGDGELAVRIKVGAVLTRRLYAAEAAEAPSGAAYGNPLRGRRGRAPSVPVGSASSPGPTGGPARLARLPGGAERGRHLRRVDRARPGQRGAGARRAAGGRGEEPPAAALRRAVERRPATRARKRSRGGLQARRPSGGAPRRGPARGRHGGGGGAPSREKAARA